MKRCDISPGCGLSGVVGSGLRSWPIVRLFVSLCGLGAVLHGPALMAASVNDKAPGFSKYLEYVKRSQTDQVSGRSAWGVTANTSPTFAIPSFETMAGEEHDPRYLLVRFNAPNAPRDALRALGLRHDKNLPMVAGLRRMHVAGMVDMATLLERVNAHSAVAYAEPDYRIHSSARPNDPGIVTSNGTTAWWLDQIRAAEAWDFATDASAIGPVAVFDTGISATHEDLRDNLWVNPGEIANNGIDDDANGYVDDVNGIAVLAGDSDHGTSVAGTLCGRGDNAIGYVGSAWSCELMDVRSLGGFDNTIAAVVEGLDYAITMGSRLSNHSWSLFVRTQALTEVVSAAEHAGHLLVVAAGNDGKNVDTDGAKWPASLPHDNVLTVAAVASDEYPYTYSNWGVTSVDLAAPSEFATTSFDGGYQVFSGTSQATPVVTGAVALAWSQVPDWSFREIRAHLLRHVRRSGQWSGLTVTGGILDMGAMLANLIIDTDGDGLTDDIDSDDDNDGSLDVDDAFPRDATETRDNDADGIGDNRDLDDDNDGVADLNDWAVFDATEQYDSDGDGIGNNADSDDDGDGTPDLVDDCPLDAMESTDTDGDGVCDNTDAFPDNAAESRDSDGDGVGDNEDFDADNDGIPDLIESSTQKPIVVWTHGGDGISITGNTVSYDGSGEFGWLRQFNSAPMSSLGFSDDYVVSWRLAHSPDGDYTMMGLGVDETEIAYADIEYGFYIAQGALAIYESGVSIGSFGTVGVDSELSIEVSAGQLSYYRDGFLLRVVDLGGTAPEFYIDGTFYAGVISLADFRVESTREDRPVDTDGDGVANRLDLDSDNDGLPDVIEAGLDDIDGDARIDDIGLEGSVMYPLDTDGDGIADYLDLESNNPDNDGSDFDIRYTPYADGDSNGDGRLNGLDQDGGQDSDGNGIDDLIEDADHDGLVDTQDDDDDNDGVPDVDDAYPLDPNESADTDGDGVGDNSDAFPDDATETLDSDGDGVGDNADAFPDDPSQSSDSDADGVGDGLDAYPADAMRWLPEISVLPVSVQEGAAEVVVQVRLSVPALQLGSITLSTLDDSATAPADYQATSQTVSFAPGEDLQSVRIPLVDDAEIESVESFTVELNNALQLAPVMRQAQVSIEDDDGSHDLDACGEPVYDQAAEAGIFLWKDCTSDEWQLRVTGGGADIARVYNGSLVAPQGLEKVEPYYLEADDILDNSHSAQLTFSLLVAGQGQDGVTFAPRAEACLSVTPPSADVQVYLGVNRVPISGPIDLDTLEACTLDPMPEPIECGAPDYDRETQQGVFLWKDCDTEQWEFRVTGGGSDLPLTYSGALESATAIATYEPYSLEANDLLESDIDNGRLGYSLIVGGPGEDGLSFVPEAHTCFSAALAGSSASVFVGAESIEFDSPVDLNTLQACQSTVLPQPAVCGPPQYDSATERGVFVWEDCVTGEWQLWVSGGGADELFSYTGSIASPGGFSRYEALSLEDNDVLDNSSDLNLLSYILFVAGAGQDGFSFMPEPDTCVSLASPDVSLFVGSEREAMPGGSVNLDTLESCQ